MTVGIPTEIKEDENRVAITPSGVAAFVSHGHELVIQAGAGAGSAITDEIYRRVGATIAETSRPTTHRDPRYVEEGVVHYCVANMPGAVPHTSTYALTNATTAYAPELADKGWRDAAEENPALAQGVNVAGGQIVHAAVARAHDTAHVPLSEV